MYGENVGETLKTIAKVTLWMGVILGVLLAFLLFGIAPFYMILGGISGFVIGWFSSVILYAFGSLVSNTQQVNEKLERLEGIQRKVDQLSEDLKYLCDVKENEIKKAGRAKTEAAKLE